jgi:hypothetical protein
MLTKMSLRAKETGMIVVMGKMGKARERMMMTTSLRAKETERVMKAMMIDSCPLSDMIHVFFK